MDKVEAGHPATEYWHELSEEESVHRHLISGVSRGRIDPRYLQPLAPKRREMLDRINADLAFRGLMKITPSNIELTPVGCVMALEGLRRYQQALV